MIRIIIRQIQIIFSILCPLSCAREKPAFLAERLIAIEHIEQIVYKYLFQIIDIDLIITHLIINLFQIIYLLSLLAPVVLTLMLGISVHLPIDINIKNLTNSKNMKITRENLQGSQGTSGKSVRNNQNQEQKLINNRLIMIMSQSEAQQFPENVPPAKIQPIRAEIDNSSFLKKRKNVMSWLSNYGEQLKISRNAVSAAKQFTDRYYKKIQYDQRRAKIVLTTLLILASKISDYKVLYTNQIAYICNYDKKQLNETQIECCLALDFNLSSKTYCMVVDQILEHVNQATGVNFYDQNQDCYVKLRLAHRIVEKFYESQAGETLNYKNIKKIVMVALKGGNGKCSNYINFQDDEGVKMEEYQQQLITMESIERIKLQWQKSKQEPVRSLFRERNKQKQFCYRDFSIRYFDEKS